VANNLMQEGGLLSRSHHQNDVVGIAGIAGIA